MFANRVTAIGSWYECQYDRAIRSAAAFDASYGAVGCRGKSSRYGSSSWAPYALSDDANTTRSIPSSRQAWRSVQVPRTFDSNPLTGEACTVLTIVSAAR